MSKVQHKYILREGILNIDPEFVPSEIALLAEKYEEIARNLVDDIKNSGFIKSKHSEYRKKILELMTKYETESDWFLKNTIRGQIYLMMEEYLKEFEETFKKLFEKYKLQFSFELTKDINVTIIQAGYAISKRDYKNPHLQIQLNIIGFVDAVLNEDKEILKLLLSIIEHELVHSAQDKKYDSRILVNYKKPAPTLLDYVISAIEIPAQSKSFASYYYYHNDKDVDKSIESLKQLEDISDEYLIRDMIKLVRDNKEHPKIKKLIKYAYLYLVQLKEKQNK
jgi:hypothetical protein